MNRMDRLVGILLLLQTRPRTSTEIAEHFEVSRRTVLRDVQALCEIGVPVIAREGVGGGYALPDDYALAPLPLSARETFLLLLALSALDALGSAPFAAERASLAAKLRALLPTAQAADAARLLGAVALNGPERAFPLPFLEDLIAAARAERWLRVVYESAERRAEHSLLPRHVYVDQGLWYVRAYSFEANDERIYRVDRVRALAVADDAQLPRRVPAPRPYDHAEHPEVVAVLTPRGAALIESEPHLGAQIQRGMDGAAHLAFRCPPGELAYFARYFASLGSDVDVRAPPELRERIRQIGENLVDRYSDW